MSSRRTAEGGDGVWGGTEKEEDERGAQEVSGREQGTPGRVESPPQDWCETQGIRRGS